MYGKPNTELHSQPTDADFFLKEMLKIRLILGIEFRAYI